MRFRKGDIVATRARHIEMEIEECCDEYFSGVVLFPECEKGYRTKIEKHEFKNFIILRPSTDNNNTPHSTFYPEKSEETVLQIEYMPVFNEYAVRISYQDEEVLCRDKFEDTEIGVSSVCNPALHYGILYIKGFSEKNDNQIIIATKEELDIIKDKVKRINEKYGSKSIKHYTSLLDKALKEAKEYSNKIKSLIKQ